MSKRRHEIARIWMRHVRDESTFYRDRRGYYPLCRAGYQREGCRIYPDWNIRYEYKTLSVRGGGQSMYWCDVCLPEKYRVVADSMLRGKEKNRTIKGEELEQIDTPRASRKEPLGTDHVPYEQLL